MLRIDIAGALITNNDQDVLLARYHVPESYEVIHELPGVAISTERNVASQLMKELRNVHGLEIVAERSCSTLVYAEDDGFVATYHVLRARLESRRRLSDDKWRFVDLRRRGVGIIGLGTYAAALSWKIQNEEVIL